MRTLVKAKTDSYEDYIDSEAGRFGDNIYSNIAKRIFKHDHDLARKQTYSTFKYSSGALRYTHSQSEHDLLIKVPDMTFVGLGAWVYEG